MKVKEIIIYPIKGLKGISVSKSNVKDIGLEGDRAYMLSDLNGNLISQRTTNELALMSVQQKDKTLLVQHKGQSIEIETGQMSDQQMEVEVWGARFSCNEVSKEISAWFAKQLGMPCKLMIMPDSKSRIKKFNKPPYESYLSFADGYPILTLGTNSVEQLNNKLSETVEANRFRANILIETSSPHEEDDWADFMIGENVKLRNIKPCVRCQVITINQENGIKGNEPLKTLSTYRKFAEGVCFGSNVIVLSQGEIKIGDEINLLP